MTRPIRRLAPETASRIAAGEVVERPLSALKEVVENALDAAARSIEIRVERALDHVFQVADDGEGIASTELELALERHATSKIGSLDELDRLTSLGFRGEALPSIAAVSRLRITSRARGADEAACLAVDAGTLVSRGTAARAPGTTVEVRELFFNTPARRKFLSSATGELRAALRMVECYALAFPEVAFRFLVDERERLDWPAAASHRERARAIWGVRHADQLIEAAGGRDGFEVEALLGLPEHARTTREGQVFLINRRWVASPMLGQALRKAYGNLLPNGRYPAATVWLSVPPERLDVNVHPTKREVRFADDGPVFSLVAGACARPLAQLHPPFTVVRGGVAEPRWADRVRERPGQESLRLGSGALGSAERTAAPAPPAPGERGPAPPAGEEAGAAPGAGRSSAAGAQEPELWQLHRTYILAPVRGGLVIIDQHAAHERILYEAARARLEGARTAGQQLLFPAIVDLTRSQFDLVLELGPWLEQLGWSLSLLGPPTVVIQGMPADVRREDPGAFLQDVLDEVSEDASRHPHEDVAERLARSYACHAAIKAGDPLTQAEMRGLVDRLFATSLPHGDPHGRVTFVQLDLDELHRRFGRG